MTTTGVRPGSDLGAGAAEVRRAALAAWDAGLQPHPAKPDGTKMPLAVKMVDEQGQPVLDEKGRPRWGWAHLQYQQHTREDVEVLFSPPRLGVGIFTGRISGNVVLFEFDDALTYRRFLGSADALGLGDLVQRIEAGYVEDTPSGGVHWLVRVPRVTRNTKLASRPKLPDELLDADDKSTKTLIETREDGGWAVLAPSFGAVHDTGRPYVLRAGSFETIADLTAAEHEQLWALAQTFDELPEDDRFQAAKRVGRPSSDRTGDRPGDRFEREADWLSDILTGWSVVSTNADNLLIRRPGKRKGWSATISNRGGGVLYVFTSSAAPLEPGACYSKFGAYAALEHGGDFKAATKALAERYGMGAKKRRQHDAEMPPAPPDDLSGAGPETESKPPKSLPRTDLGNAERLVKRHGHEIRYSHQWGAWLVWEGRRWAKDETGEMSRRAKETVRHIYVEASETDDNDERAMLASWAKNSESVTRIDAMLKAARSEPGMPMLTSDMDVDPFLLNVLNGTVDLRTGQLRPHDPQDNITKLAPVEYDPSAECPIFLAFLEDVQPSLTVREFLQRIAGYGATGDTTEQCLFFLHGGGANGKSTWLMVMQDLLGDYAREAAPELLTIRGGDRHPTELADLFGARFVTSSEVDEGKRLAEALVKKMTGGESMKARPLYRDFFEWNPTHKLFLAANHRPVIRGNDHGIWRRIHLIPFEVTIPPDRRDPKLGAKLAKERPGILRWLIEGCLAWQRDGLRVPDAVHAATERYRVDQDVLAGFLGDHCVIDGQATVQTTPLFKAYVTWAEESGEKPMTMQAFGRRLTERGFVGDREKTGQRARIWRGLRFSQPGEAPSPAEIVSRPVPATSGRMFEEVNSSSPLKGTFQTNRPEPDDTGRKVIEGSETAAPRAWRCPKCTGFERTVYEDGSWKCDGCGAKSPTCEYCRRAPALDGARGCSACEGRGT